MQRGDFNSLLLTIVLQLQQTTHSITKHQGLCCLLSHQQRPQQFMLIFLKSLDELVFDIL